MALSMTAAPEPLDPAVLAAWADMGAAIDGYTGTSSKQEVEEMTPEAYVEMILDGVCQAWEDHGGGPPLAELSPADATAVMEAGIMATRYGSYRGDASDPAAVEAWLEEDRQHAVRSVMES